MTPQCSDLRDPDPRSAAVRNRREPGAGEFVVAWDAILGVLGVLDIRAGIGGSAKVTLEGLFQRIRLGRYNGFCAAGLLSGWSESPEIARFYRPWRGSTVLLRRRVMRALGQKVTENKMAVRCEFRPEFHPEFRGKFHRKFQGVIGRQK